MNNRIIFPTAVWRHLQVKTHSNSICSNQDFTGVIGVIELFGLWQFGTCESQNNKTILLSAILLWRISALITIAVILPGWHETHREVSCRRWRHIQVLWFQSACWWSRCHFYWNTRCNLLVWGCPMTPQPGLRRWKELVAGRCGPMGTTTTTTTTKRHQKWRLNSSKWSTSEPQYKPQSHLHLLPCGVHQLSDKVYSRTFTTHVDLLSTQT